MDSILSEKGALGLDLTSIAVNSSIAAKAFFTVQLYTNSTKNKLAIVTVMVKERKLHFTLINSVKTEMIAFETCHLNG